MPARQGHQRAVFFALGWLSFALGLLGLLLPVLPTTPFMLLALWAFARSSRRFHDWLYTHRVFGPPLQRWDRERSVPAPVKAVALASMAASTAYVGLVVRPPWYALAGMLVVVGIGAIYVLRIPGRPRAQRSPPRGR